MTELADNFSKLNIEPEPHSKIINKRTGISKTNHFIKYCNYMKFMDVSGISCIIKIPDKFRTTNGCAWCRTDTTPGLLKSFKYILIKKGKKCFKFNYGNMDESGNTIDKLKLDELFKEYPNNNSVIGFKFCGKIIPKIYNNSIRHDIRDTLLKKYKECVNCSHTKQLEIDHKNDLKNNPRVLNIKTQYISDFQVLCKKCNDMKRGYKKIMIDTCKRIISPFKNVPFIKGDESLDIKNPDCLVGSYWYDCEVFNDSLIMKPPDALDDISDDLKKLSI